jgi:hypothetical protein
MTIERASGKDAAVLAQELHTLEVELDTVDTDKL